LLLLAFISHRFVAIERRDNLNSGGHYRFVNLLAAIGLYSYPIYLWHYDGAFKIIYPLTEAGWFGPQDSQLRWAIGTTLYVMLAIGAGVLISRCLEMPIIALRDRLFPRAAAPV
jgi:peptidoglycan/LPS O-acetylase OafA/YrhL